jgi:Gamma-glutamyl cyclotransferase, AIG2-like
VARRLFYGTMTVAPPGEALLERASFVEEARTAPRYRLFSLSGFPVLVEDHKSGCAIDVQVWDVPDDRWQRILEDEPPELVPGDVALEDGRRVKTMLGPREWVDARGGVDVSAHGSWRAYLAAES